MPGRGTKVLRPRQAPNSSYFASIAVFRRRALRVTVDGAILFEFSLPSSVQRIGPKLVIVPPAATGLIATGVFTGAASADGPPRPPGVPASHVYYKNIHGGVGGLAYGSAGVAAGYGLR